MLTLDHPRLVGRQLRELKRFRTYLVDILPGVSAPAVQILHEPDSTCCRGERWRETRTTLTLAV
jgi:hypothetical protein